MKKSTKIIIIGIGVLSILSGIYSMINKDELYNILNGILLGVILIGSVYFDQKGNIK